MVIVPLGSTLCEVFASGGNPYGATYTSGDRSPGQPTEQELEAGRAQGARLARYASVIAAAHVAGDLPKPGVPLAFPSRV